MIEFSLTGSVDVIDGILIYNNRLMMKITLNIIDSRKLMYKNIYSTYEIQNFVERMHTIIQEKK